MENSQALILSGSNNTLPILDLPVEIVSNILRVWIGPVTLSGGANQSIRISNIPDLAIPRRASVLLCEEIDRFLWYTSWKTFYDADDFEEVVTTLSSSPHGKHLIEVGDATPRALNFQGIHHGLEKIELNFTADEYVAFFNVDIPPFDDPDWKSQFPCWNAGRHLAQTRVEHLVLCFGDTKFDNPWYDCGDGRWTEPRPEPDFSDIDIRAPCLRPNVCKRGLIVDWILEYAWYRNRLQHIPRIELEGNIQEWVRDKWTTIFRRQAEDPNYVYTPDIDTIRSIGWDEAEMLGEEWDPTLYYPPVCQCEPRCDRLGQIGQKEFTWAESLWEDHLLLCQGDEVVGDWNGEDVVPEWVLQDRKREDEEFWEKARIDWLEYIENNEG